MSRFTHKGTEQRYPFVTTRKRCVSGITPARDEKSGPIDADNSPHHGGVATPPAYYSSESCKLALESENRWMRFIAKRWRAC